MILSAWSVKIFGAWFWIPMAIHTFYTLYVGEMLPKAYALIKANIIAKINAPFLLPLVKVCGPVLSKIAPQHEKTPAEKCLEERLKAEAEAGVLTLESLITSHGMEELPKGYEVKMKASHTATIIEVERKMMREINNDYKASAFFFIAVFEYPVAGEPKLLGHLHYTAFQFKDWDHPEQTNQAG